MRPMEARDGEEACRRQEQGRMRSAGHARGSHEEVPRRGGVREEAPAGDVPCRIPLPEVRLHHLLQGQGPCPQVAGHEVLEAVLRHEGHDDGEDASSPHGLVHGHLARREQQARHERGGAADVCGLQLQERRVPARQDTLRHVRIGVPSMRSMRQRPRSMMHISGPGEAPQAGGRPSRR